jgi:hypothetical protein
VKDHGYFLSSDIDRYKEFITLDSGNIIWSHREKPNENGVPPLPYIYPRPFPYWWNVGGGWKYAFANAGNANIAKSVVACVMDGLKVTGLILSYQFGWAAKLAAKIAALIAPGILLATIPAAGALGLVVGILEMFTNTPNNIDRPY